MASDPFIAPSAPWLHQGPNDYTISPSAISNPSSSASSVFSLDAPSSQSSASSVSTSWTAAGWINKNQHINQQVSTGSNSALKENVPPRPYKPSGLSQASECIKAVAPEARQHPRRTQRLYSQDSQDGSSSTPCLRPPPPLVRQSERKVNFVDSLVGKLM